MWVAKIIRDKRVAARFRRLLLEKGLRDYRTLNDPAAAKFVSTQDEDFPPHRALALDEAYHFMAVAHDAVVTDAPL